MIKCLPSKFRTIQRGLNCGAMRLWISLVSLAAISIGLDANDDLYQLLGVAKDASLKEIRRAFKNLAVLKHPDKNPDDEDAHSAFIQLTRAYDILKDPDTRKTYDLFGDSEFGQPSAKFKSYAYYKNDFGIYDDDPLIVTLSKADFELHVLDETQAWWVNFYSPSCHHCHKLAPTWRQLAEELEGVVRFGAVNCEDDWVLCRQLAISAYPTLLYYEKQAHLYAGEKYTGPKNFLDLQNFIIANIRVQVDHISNDTWPALRTTAALWLLFLCATNCPSPATQIKLAAVFEGLMSVGIVEDAALCEEMAADHASSPVVLVEVHEYAVTMHKIAGNDKKDYVEGILKLLPAPEHVDEQKYAEIRSELQPWLLCFYLGSPTELSLQLRRLPAHIPHVRLGLVHCGRSSGLCSALHVSSYPTWGLLKAGGAFEKHHGRDVLLEVADFAREGAKATNLRTLTPADFLGMRKQEKEGDGQAWFIDWYAPWCPPCRRLMPQMRKASQRFREDEVMFGTVDCTLHTALCSAENIRAYPTAILYARGKQQQYHGVLDESSMVEFISDALNPAVVALTGDNFVRLMRKPLGQMWVVDFYAPWCGPCLQLMPVWRGLAREMQQFENITIASVDCVDNGVLCNQQNIRSYPMIRLYPADSLGLNSVTMYTGHRDLMHLKQWIFAFVPSKVVTLDRDLVRAKILKRKKLKKPWLVDFYVPWCGHCVDFEPKFRRVADDLVGVARAGKLDCQAERGFCIDLRVTSYPTLRLYFSATKFYHIAARDASHVIEEVQTIIQSESQHFDHDEL